MMWKVSGMNSLKLSGLWTLLQKLQMSERVEDLLDTYLKEHVDLPSPEKDPILNLLL